MKVEYSRFRRKRVSDEVFDVLKEKILDGVYKVGDKIPSENELTELLGVSRSSIRAAIERLKTIGLVQVIVGDGTYVTEFDLEGYIENFAEVIINPKDFVEITELRQAIEIQSIHYAIQRIDDGELTALREIAKKVESAAAKRDYKLSAKYDFDFHLQICKASKNKYLETMFQIAGRVIFDQIQKLVEKFYADTSKAEFKTDHTLLVEAIARKDFEEAKVVYYRMTDVAYLGYE